MKRSLTKLHCGAVRELDARTRTPAALLETGETSVRAEQRIDASRASCAACSAS